MTGFQNDSALTPLRPEDPREVAGYQLIRRIGEGGMGTVYLSHTRGGQPVALKVIRREYAEDEEFRRRFQQEVQSARRVQGYHVVPVVDHDTTGTQPWLAGTYIPGLPLDEALARYASLPLPAVLQLIGCAAEALRAVHAAGIIHRDLKPSNILLGADGPWVIDFGIARAGDATQLTRSGGLIGTPQYMSPEHANGQDLTPATDVFSLGLIAAVAATGRHPYGDSGAITVATRIANTDQRPPDLSGYPAELRPLLERCLSADPAARATPEELAGLCARGAGRPLRDFQGWLPAPLAADIARREAAAREAASAGRGSAAYTPTVNAGHPAYAETQTADSVPPSTPPNGMSPGSKKALTALGAVIAVALVGGLVYKAVGPDGGTPVSQQTTTPAPPPTSASQSTAPASPSAAYQVLFQDRVLTVRPPNAISDGVQVDLDTPKVDPTRQLSDSEVDFSYSDDYLNFYTPTGKAHAATPEACKAAADTEPLPAQLDGKALGPGKAIAAGDILCTVTKKGNLAMWQISVAEPTYNYNKTPAFSGKLTLWKLPAGR